MNGSNFSGGNGLIAVLSWLTWTWVWRTGGGGRSVEQATQAFAALGLKPQNGNQIPEKILMKV